MRRILVVDDDLPSAAALANRHMAQARCGFRVAITWEAAEATGTSRQTRKTRQPHYDCD